MTAEADGLKFNITLSRIQAVINNTHNFKIIGARYKIELDIHDSVVVTRLS